jgi:hypothetical protein
LGFLIHQVTNLNSRNQSEISEVPSDTTETSYSAELAEELGADDYGMRQYVMAFLKTGPNRSTDSTKAMELQGNHLETYIGDIVFF